MKFFIIFFCFLFSEFKIIKRPYPLTLLTDEQFLYWSFFSIFGSITIWWTILLTVVTALLPDVIISLIENIQAQQLIAKETEKAAKRIEVKPESFIRNAMNDQQSNALFFPNPGYYNDINLDDINRTHQQSKEQVEEQPLRNPLQVKFKNVNNEENKPRNRNNVNKIFKVEPKIEVADDPGEVSFKM
jgi:hypothetical protein